MRSILLVCLLAVIAGCSSDSDSDTTKDTRDYRQDMRDFVIGISQKAKTSNPGFIVIPQNGIELISSTGEADGTINTAYLYAIDGNGQEDFLFGYDNDNEASSAEVTYLLKSFLDVSKNAGKTILVTDYCTTASYVAQSYNTNNSFGYVSYAAPQRNLDVIPTTAPYNVNTDVITSLSQAKNFLYLINPDKFTSKAEFIAAVTATNYDAVIMDLFLDNEAFTSAEIAQLKNKANGGKRLVISYMSIGEAEDYRYYWQTAWNTSTTKPEWIKAVNPEWAGNYKVEYWNDEWQGLIYKNDDSYLNKITAAGFDGVYLDIIDAFEYFEQ